MLNALYTHTQTCKHRDSDHMRTAMARSWTQFATSVQQLRTSPVNYQTIGVSTVIHYDGCDVTQGLIESTKLQWSGDVDLNDGSLQKQYEAYRKRLAFAENIGLDEEHSDVIGQLTSVSKDISDDLELIHSGKRKYSVVSVFQLDIFIRYSHNQRQC